MEKKFQTIISAELENLAQNLALAANMETAAKMEKYLRNLFPFFGIPKPQRAQITKGYIKNVVKEKTASEVIVIMQQLFSLPQREFHYVAIDLFIKTYKQFDFSQIVEALDFINQKSWWDSIDTLKKPFSLWCLLYPEKFIQIVNICRKGTMWQRRTAIILQLAWKEKTNTQILSEIILENLEDKEFFIQKAIGWSLRDFSRTQPDWVKNFVEQNQLTGLARREALKLLK